MHTVRPPRRWPPAALLSAALLVTLVGLPAQAQQINLASESYIIPPQPIVDAVLNGRGAIVSLTNISPDGKKFLITKSDGMPTVERMGKSHVYLGEMAFDHVANRSRNLWVNSSPGYDLFFYADNRTVPVKIPEKTRVSNPVWSPDGSKLAFFVHSDDATHIYLADGETGSSRRLTATPVLATLATSFQWSKDGKKIQTVLLPDDGKRPAPKPEPGAEFKVRVARDGQNPSRTYRYLLESPQDMKLLEHLSTGQLALVDVNDGQVTKIGFPDMIRTVSTAPGEELFRVGVMKKPFSYHVPAANFGANEGIWSTEGKSLYTLSDRNLRGGGGDAQTKTVQNPTGQGKAQAKAGGRGAGKGGGRGAGKGGGRGAGQGKAQPPATTQPPTDPNQPPPTQPPTDPTQPPPDPTQVDPNDPNAQPGQRGGGAPVDPNGKRELGWRPDGVGMSFLQLEPEVKDSKEPRKDRVMQWLPPFGEKDVKVVYETPNRITGLQYSEDGKLLFMSQTIENQRKTVAVDLADPKTLYVIPTGNAPAGDEGGGGGRGGAGGGGDGDDEILDPNDPAFNRFDPGYGDGIDYYAEQQRGQQPGGRGGRGGAAGGGGGGGLMARPGRGAVNVVRISSAGDVYVSGSERGGGSAKPYIDKINIKTGKKERIFEGKADMPETVTAVDGDDVTRVFTTRQRSDVAPNTFFHDLKTAKVTQLTNNVDHNPWFHKVKTETFTVTRVDGFKFRVRVTRPPDAPAKMPALFWIYPREYTDQAAYDGGGRGGGAGGGGRGGGGGNFAAPAPRGMQLWTLMGYAVVEPDVPIVGPQGRMNDNYVTDLRNSLWAVIDDLDKRGIIDRDRLAVGGHSYGGFSTANTLAHTPFFKAGIAGDGCYNRTLTPMSFQSERRNIWDARETYLEMSPFLWANHVNGALLMYHSMEDANVGTNPINAEFMFMAMEGLGKPSALYMYPYEGHGPIAKETVLDQWARWVGWLDKYVKNAKK